MEQRRQTIPQMLRKNVEAALSGKGTLADVRGIPDETMKACYAAAYNFYNQGRFIEALNIFTILCNFNNWNASYWLGLGMTRQMLKDFTGAVEAYGLATILDNTNPKAPFYAADCLIALKEYDKSKMALEAAIAAVENNKQKNKKYEAILKKAKSILESMRKSEKGSEKVNKEK